MCQFKYCSKKERKAFVYIFGVTFSEKITRTSMVDLKVKQETDRLFSRRNRTPDQWEAFIKEKYSPLGKRADIFAMNIGHSDIKQKPPVSTFEKFQTESELLVEKKIVDELRSTTDKYEKVITK